MHNNRKKKSFITQLILSFLQLCTIQIKKNLIYIFVFSIFIGIIDSFGISIFILIIKSIQKQYITDLYTTNIYYEWFVLLLKKISLEVNLKTIILIFILVFLIKSIFVYFFFIYKNFIKLKWLKSIRFRLINAMKNIPYDEFQKISLSDIQSTFSNELRQAGTSFDRILNAAYFFILIIFYIIISLYINPILTCIIILLYFPLFFIYKYINKLITVSSIEIKKQHRSFILNLIQTLLYFKYLKITNHIKKISVNLKKQTVEFEELQYYISKLKAIIFSTKEIIIIIMILTFIYISNYIMHYEWNLTLIILFLSYRNYGFFIQFQNAWQAYLTSYGNIEGLQDTLSKIEIKKECNNGKKILDKPIQKIEFENVSYKIENREILKNINLIIQKNIIIKGVSGSGKTTLINLLTGLYKPTNGIIKINGHRISELNQNILRKKIGFICQEPVIFPCSIYENITLNKVKTKKDFKMFQKICKQVQLEKLIDKLPKNENSIIYDLGTNLSGGERQRISIARELFKNPEIIILDEATNALDDDTKNLINKKIFSTFKNRIIIVISHRNTTFENFTKIVYLKQGQMF